MKASAANEGPRTVGWTKMGTQKRQGILHAIAWTTALLIGVLGARTAHADTCATFLNCKDPHQPICGLDSQCHPCTANSDCVPIGGATSVCLGASGDAGATNNGECSQPCSVDSGICSGSTPVCSGALGACVGCSSDNGGSTLACPDPNLPACQGGILNALAGSCTQCSASNQGQCTGTLDKPVCDPAVGECGCVSDGNCGQGRYCDRSSVVDGGLPPDAGDAGPQGGICRVGCRLPTDAGANGNCPTGKTCVVDGGTIGVCKGTGCNSDSDCKTAPFLKCDTANTHECVQCTQDTDCKGGKVCETDTGNPNYGMCVDCTQTKKQKCSNLADAGAVCIPTSDQCGCTSDPDCGDRKSGRVCGGSASQHSCIPGCRGTGGNGCPDGEVCSSTDNSIGTCNPSDGGLDGGANDGSAGDGGGADAEADAAGNGVSLDGLVEGGGCACMVGAGDASPLLGLGLALVTGLAVVTRRRRRK